jgi:hypothetical protein
MTEVFHQRFQLTGWLTSATTESYGSSRRLTDPGGNQPPQPQAPPQQPPPDGAGAPASARRPPTATVDSSFTVSSWPSGQAHGAEDSRIGRVTSNVEPQARQRYS